MAWWGYCYEEQVCGVLSPWLRLAIIAKISSACWGFTWRKLLIVYALLLEYFHPWFTNSETAIVGDNVLSNKLTMRNLFYSHLLRESHAITYADLIRFIALYLSMFWLDSKRILTKSFAEANIFCIVILLDHVTPWSCDFARASWPNPIRRVVWLVFRLF